MRILPAMGFVLFAATASAQTVYVPPDISGVWTRNYQISNLLDPPSSGPGPNSQDRGREWYGDSVGHCEGGTLVVDTIGQNDKTHIDRFATPLSDKVHVAERYGFSADGQTLEAEVTVEDHVAFTVSWSGRAIYRAIGIRGSRMFAEKTIKGSFGPVTFFPLPSITLPISKFRRTSMGPNSTRGVKFEY